jgi:hypothetical protein
MAWERISESGLSRERARANVLREAEPETSDKALVFDDELEVGAALEIVGVHILYIPAGSTDPRSLVLQVFQDIDLIREIPITAAPTDEPVEIEMGNVCSNDNGIEILPPDLALLPGQTLRIVDTAEVNPGGDGMTVHVHGLWRF